MVIFPKETQRSPKPILKSEMTKPEITNKVDEREFSVTGQLIVLRASLGQCIYSLDLKKKLGQKTFYFYRY